MNGFHLHCVAISLHIFPFVPFRRHQGCLITNYKHFELWHHLISNKINSYSFCKLDDPRLFLELLIKYLTNHNLWWCFHSILSSFVTEYSEMKHLLYPMEHIVRTHSHSTRQCTLHMSSRAFA